MVGIEIRLPELGEGIESADVVALRAVPGELVKRDQPLLEIESEKASLEVPAPADGTLVEFRVAPGDRVAPGQAIALMEPAAGGAEAGGEAPSVEAPPAEASNAPAPPPAKTAPAAAAPPESPPRAAPPPPATEAVRPSRRPPRLIPASPKVRRFARELGVDLTRVQGSGPRGRITEEDVKAAVRDGRTAGSAAVGVGEPLPDLGRWGAVKREPMSTVRRLTAEAMARSWAQVTHVTHHDHADITEIDSDRKRLAAEAGTPGDTVTLTAVLVRLVAEALRRFPTFNAAVDMARKEIVYRTYINIGVAVDTPRGLVVPVIRDAADKGAVRIAEELSELAERARARRLQPAEMQGAGFTISNLGGIGGAGFTPLVPWPQVAILGVSRASVQPVWNGESFAPRLLLPLALSYDHRIIDGADAARFLRWLCRTLERPLLALM